MRLAWASLLLAMVPAAGILFLGLWIVVLWRPLSDATFTWLVHIGAVAALLAGVLGRLALWQMRPDQLRRGGRQIALEGFSVGVVTFFYCLFLLLRLSKEPWLKVH